MVQINNELTKKFLEDKMQEFRKIGNRKNIIDSLDHFIKSDVDLIKQALIERSELLKKEILEQWEKETAEQRVKINEQQKALSDYEEDIRQIESLKQFKSKRIKFN